MPLAPRAGQGPQEALEQQGLQVSLARQDLLASLALLDLQELLVSRAWPDQQVLLGLQD